MLLIVIKVNRIACIARTNSIALYIIYPVLFLWYSSNIYLVLIYRAIVRVLQATNVLSCGLVTVCAVALLTTNNNDDKNRIVRMTFCVNNDLISYYVKMVKIVEVTDI